VASNEPSVALRRYPADNFAEALTAYEADLPALASAGWYPVAQAWGWDSVGSAGFLFGGSSWKPGPGTLAVTYRRDDPQP